MTKTTVTSQQARCARDGADVTITKTNRELWSDGGLQDSRVIRAHCTDNVTASTRPCVCAMR